MCWPGCAEQTAAVWAAHRLATALLLADDPNPWITFHEVVAPATPEC
ncbi:hypothetical protein [Streptomyces nigrescens]